MRSLRRWSLWLGLAALSAGAQACPSPLRIGFSDSASPPGLLGQGEHFQDPPGWEVLVVREALRHVGCTAELRRMPSRRLSASLQQGQLEFALLYAATPERLHQMGFPLDAQGQPDLAWAPAFGHLALYGPRGSAVDPAWDGHQLPARWRVGVLAGSVQDTLARARGWNVEPITASESELAMLQARRFDLLLTTREGLSPQQRARLREWSPLVAREPYFVPAAQELLSRDPAWVRSFWNELCRAARRLQPDVRPSDCGTVPAEARR